MGKRTHVHFKLYRLNPTLPHDVAQAAPGLAPLSGFDQISVAHNACARISSPLTQRLSQTRFSYRTGGPWALPARATERVRPDLCRTRAHASLLLTQHFSKPRTRTAQAAPGLYPLAPLSGFDHASVALESDVLRRYDLEAEAERKRQEEAKSNAARLARLSGAGVFVFSGWFVC